MSPTQSDAHATTTHLAEEFPQEAMRLCQGTIYLLASSTEDVASFEEVARHR